MPGGPPEKLLFPPGGLHICCHATGFQNSDWHVAFVMRNERGRFID